MTRTSFPGVAAPFSTDDTESCRGLAARFRELASCSQDPRVTPSLLELADEYEAEAVRLEADRPGPDRAG